MNVPVRWINFARRVFGLARGRWVILLDLSGDTPVFEVVERSKTEH